MLGTFIAFKLFRWEKEEKVKPAAKLWVLAVLVPFVIIGTWNARTDEAVVQARMTMRAMERGHAYLIRDARLIIGDGQVIEPGGVLLKDGKIVQVYEGSSPDPKSLKAEAMDAAGKTLIPGLIDTHVHLGNPGGLYEQATDYAQDAGVVMPQELAAYLYSGITAVRSAGRRDARRSERAPDDRVGRETGRGVVSGRSTVHRAGRPSL